MRLAHSAKVFDNSQNTIDESVFRDLILSKFRYEFRLKIEKARQNSLSDELLYFILSPEEELWKVKGNQNFSSILSLIQQIARLYRNQVPNLDIGFKEWFFQNLSTKELANFENEAEEKLDIHHYISFIRHRKLYDKLIIWIDNLDSFSNDQQLLISNFLQNIQRSLLNTCNIVISVREENIYRIGEFKDYLNEPFISSVTFEDPSEEEHDAVNFSVIKKETLQTLTGKKIEFAYSKYKQYVEKKESGEEPGFEAPGIEFSNDYILTTDEINGILTFSEKLVRCFNLEKVIYLSNNSIRDYLRIHAGFLEAIFSEKSVFYKKLIEEDANDWRITTEFLGWLYKINEAYRLDIFNVLKEINRNDIRIENKEILCFLPYIILTKIWNECLILRKNDSPKNNPNLNNIINDIIETFSFEEDEVLKTIYDLYSNVRGRSNFISFRKKTKIEKPEQLKDLNTTVRITLRGKTVIGHVINSFGYLRQCCEEIETDVKTSNYESILIKNIKSISQIHLQSLQTLRKQKYNGNDNWVETYLAKYGIPIDPNFVRNQNVGKPISNIEHYRALYLQTVFVSLSNYFYYRRSITLKNEVDFIKDRFFKFLTELGEGKEFEIFLFEKD